MIKYLDNQRLRGAALSLVLTLMVLTPQVSVVHDSVVVGYTSAQAEDVQAKDGITKIQLILKKLRGSMTSMKDFNELEVAGMPRKDVERMRKAMSNKIKQLTDQAIDLIRAL